MKLEEFYKKNYKLLMLIPIIVLIISLAFISYNYMSKGELINRDVTLKGGISATIYTDKPANIKELQNAIKVDSIVRTLTDFSTGKQVGVIIEVSDIKAEELKSILESALNIKLTDQIYSVEETGAALGESFFKELIYTVLIAFLLMSIVVFITFRTFIPPIAVIFAALIDITIPLAIINFLGMKISSAGIVAFLLLIGYSVDTDILLTTRLLKRTDSPLFNRMYNAMKTGLTMTFCAISVMVIGIIFSTSPIFKEMFFIILLGLIVDIFSTWLTNSGILYLYCKKSTARSNFRTYNF